MIDGYKNINKETNKLIKQFNHKVDQIKKEEIAIDNLRTKYNQLMSGAKAPASLTAMESQIRKNEKELISLEKQYNEVIAKIESNKIDLEFANGSNDTKRMAQLNYEQSDLDNKSFVLASQLENARDKNEKLKKSLSELKVNPSTSVEAKNLSAKIVLAEQNLNKAKSEAHSLGKNIEKIESNRLKGFGINALTVGKGFKEVNSKLDSFKRKMTRLISTAMVFSLLRRGLNNLSNGFISLLKSNDIFANSLNQIKVNLISAFTPIYNAVLPALTSLMNMLSKVTGTIAVFINSLFGNTASQAKKNAKSLYEQAKATAAVEEAQEGLASFDKLEVNNENTSQTGGSSKPNLNFDGEITYSQKLLDLLNEIKNFVSENKEVLLGFLGGVIGCISAIKLGLGVIKALGIGVMIYGIINLISSLIEYLNDPSWESFGAIIQSIGWIILGLGVTIGSVPLIVAGAIALITGLVVLNWEKIKGILQNAILWIYNNLDNIKEKFGIFGVFIATIFAHIIQWVIRTFEDTFGGLKRILDGIIDLVAGVFTGDWERAWNGIKNIVGGVFQTLFGIIKAPLNGIIALLNGVIDGVNYLISGLNKISFDVPDWVPFMGGKKFGFNIPKIGTIPMLAEGAVIPPNKKFTAVLGDQKNGKNLEGPESLFRKIVREESREKDVVLNATFIIQADTGEEFGRAAINSVRLCEDIDGKPYFV